MPKITVYRYDDCDYPDGQVIPGRGEFFDHLTSHQQAVELAIRTALPSGTSVRSTSLYTWADQNVARRLWRLSGRKYLYELEVDETNIRHKGDLNFYSTAVDAVKAGNSPNYAVARYCSGEEAGPPYTEPRIEVLVSKARVVKKL